MDRERSLGEHLEELRNRLLMVIVVFFLFSVIGFYLSEDIIKLIQADLFPESVGVKLIASRPMEFLQTRLNVGLFFGVLFSLPVAIYQAMVFLRPALLEKERRILLASVLGGSILFVSGVTFSYFVLMRFTLWFLASLVPEGILNLWSVGSFVSFVLLFSVAMGLVFQLPLVVILLLKLGIVGLEELKSMRRYVVVLVFVIAAVITPTVDPLTQTIVALPMLVLYEIGLVLGRFVEKR